MRKLLLASTVIGVCLLGIGLVSAAPSNFAGTWTLDKSKSQLPGQMATADITWVITQDDKQLSYDTKVVVDGQERPPQNYVYKLDGSETTAEMTGRMPGKATRTAKWTNDGKVLELKQVQKGNFQGTDVTITTTDHWELADGGKTLKVHRAIESPQGAREQTMVFAKK
jgi:hypothetical protein